ncbi:hypothetical protein Tco_1196551, partial [Tanacetum coccineum]
MSSITTQQTKLDLVLLPKEKRLDIGKCNGRLDPGKIQREPTFQVVLCIPEDLHASILGILVIQAIELSTDTNRQKRRDSNSIWNVFRDIFRSATRYRMHSTTPGETSAFAFLLLSLTKVYSSGKKHYPIGKSKRIKRPTKKSTKAPARGVVIRETPEIPVSKKNEKVDVTRGKGIELLSQVALTEDAQFEEVRKKSIYEADSWGNDEDDSNNEQESSSEDSDQKNDSDDDKTQSDNENESNSEHETDENESGSESDQDKNEEDEDYEEEMKDELVKTPSNDSDNEDETKITDKAGGDEDEEMDYTTSQLYDDVDIRLNKPKTEVPVTSSSHSSNLVAKFLNFSDIPHTDAEIVSPMDVHVHHDVPSQQTPALLTVPISVISDSSPVFSTIIQQSLPSFTTPPQQSTSTPPPTTEAINPPPTLPNFASVFHFNNRVKKDPLHTQVTAIVDDHLDTRLGATRDEFMNFLS